MNCYVYCVLIMLVGSDMEAPMLDFLRQPLLPHSPLFLVTFFFTLSTRRLAFVDHINGSLVLWLPVGFNQ